MNKRYTFSRFRVGGYITAGLLVFCVGLLLSRHEAVKKAERSNQSLSGNSEQAERGDFDVPSPSAGGEALRSNRQFGSVGSSDLVVSIGDQGARQVDITTVGFSLVAFGAGHQVSVSNGQRSKKNGEPDLPRVVYGFTGEAGHAAHVKLGTLDYDTYEDIDIVPVEDGVLKADGSPYEEDAFWPPQLVEVREAYAGRKKLVRVSYSPFQYNPVTRELRHYRDLQSTITQEPEVPKQVSAAIKSASTAFDDVVGGVVPGDCGCAEPRIVPTDLIAVPRGQPEDFARRQSGVAFDACFKIRITETGLHKLTYRNLLDAGVPDAELAGNNLRMFYKDRELAITTSVTGKFTDDSDHFVRFYAERFESDQTNDNYYWLGFGAGGLRMGERTVPDNAGLGAAIDQACRSVTLDQGAVRFDSLVPLFRHITSDVDVDNGLYDGWFLGTIKEARTAQPVELIFPGTDAAVSGSVSFEATAYGVTTPADHWLNVVNQSGAAVFAHSYNGVKEEAVTQSFSSSLLNTAGTTTLSILGSTIAQAGGNSFVIDRHNIRNARIEFSRYLHATGDALSFGGTVGNQRYEIQKLSVAAPSAISLLDVSDGFEPIRLVGYSIFSNGLGAGVRFVDNRPINSCYYVSGPGGEIVVDDADIVAASFGNLSDTARQHDYIAIVPAGYEADARRLLEHRDQFGHDVFVVTDEEIYDEFGYGIRHPMAIRQFLGYAFHHWLKEPKSVLLVGDSHFDPLDRLGTSGPIVLPCVIEVVATGHAPVDAQFVQVNGDDHMADMAIGRMPVENVGHFSAMVDKTLLHDTSFDAGAIANTWRSRLHFIADNQELTDPNFGGDVQTFLINGIVQSPYTATLSQLQAAPNQGQIDGKTSEIVSAINAGRIFTSFTGHGSLVQWASENMFDDADAVSSLSNSAIPTIVTVFACQNGVFHHPTAVGLAETFMRTANKGAVAVLAPGALADHQSSLSLSEGFYNAALKAQVPTGFSEGLLYSPAPIRTVGEAYLGGLAGVFFGPGPETRELDFYVLFGDPAAVIRQP
jgi:hypothetical protein